MHVTLNQTEYKSHYYSLTHRLEIAKENLETVMAKLNQMQTRKADIEAFLQTFKTLPNALTDFNLVNWNVLVEYAICFTFKNKQEIQT